MKGLLRTVFGTAAVLCACPSWADSYLSLEGGGETYHLAPGDYRRSLATVGIGTVEDRYDANLSIPYVVQSGAADASGVGDVVGRAGVIAWRGERWQLGFSGILKLPTASARLGSGQTDAGAFVNVSGLGAVRPNLFVGYVANGNSSTTNYENVLDYGGTISARMAYNGVTIGVEARRGIKSGDTLTDASAGVFHLFNSEYAVTASLQGELQGNTGFRSITLGLVRWF